MSVLKQIIRQWCEGRPIKAIIRHTGTARNTVKSYIRQIRQQELDCRKLLDMEDEQLRGLFEPGDATADQYRTLQELMPYFFRELERTGVNRWVLWNEYKQQHPDGYQYSQFCHHLRQYQKSSRATLPIAQSAGDKLYVDFTGKKLNWVDTTTGEVHEAEVFVATLGYSQLTYAEAVPSQKQGAFLQCIDNALHYIGGVPQAIVPDNLKAAVIRADKYEPALNEALSDLANHYNTTILPARSRKPRDKAWVENTIRTLYSRIFAPLRNRTFHSLASLNKAIREHLGAHNRQAFQGEDFSRQQRFDEHERSTLGALPAERYEHKQFRWLTVMKNCHIRISEDKHYYSVPYRYIGCKVKVITTQRHVSVWYKAQRIAFHKRDFRAYKYSTVREHMPSQHRFVSEWNADRFLRWAAAISPEVHDFIKAVLDSKPYPEQAYRSCAGILAFHKKVGAQRLSAACQRAAHFRAYNYKAIQGILNNGLENQQLPHERQMTMELPEHENIRGPESFE